jgi:hypothetical protein
MSRDGQLARRDVTAGATTLRRLRKLRPARLRLVRRRAPLPVRLESTLWGFKRTGSPDPLMRGDPCWLSVFEGFGSAFGDLADLRR